MTVPRALTLAMLASNSLGRPLFLTAACPAPAEYWRRVGPVKGPALVPKHISRRPTTGGWMVDSGFPDCTRGPLPIGSLTGDIFSSEVGEVEPREDRDPDHAIPLRSRRGMGRPPQRWSSDCLGGTGRDRAGRSDGIQRNGRGGGGRRESRPVLKNSGDPLGSALLE